MDDIIARIGESVKRHRETAWQVAVLALVGWSAFNVGILRSGREAVSSVIAEPLIETRESIVSQNPSDTGQGSPNRSDPRVVVSKASSSKKYHYSWCSSGQRIKEKNRIWFPSEQAARDAGYTLAGNCTR